jgi:hypothetical protein
MCQQATLSAVDLSDDAAEWTGDSRYVGRKPRIEDLFDDAGPDFADADVDFLAEDPDEDEEDDFDDDDDFEDELDDDDDDE